MSDSKDIRRHLIENYVSPASRNGHYTVTVRAGDIAKEMSPSPAFPAICGVLGSDTFEQEARLRRIAIDGPVPGVSTLFVFRLE
jgi:hypothetical protein